LSKSRIERTIHKQKIVFSLLVVEMKISEKETSLRLEMRSLVNKLEDMFSALKNFIGLKEMYYLICWRAIREIC